MDRKTLTGLTWNLLSPADRRALAKRNTAKLFAGCSLYVKEHHPSGGLTQESFNDMVVPLAWHIGTIAASRSPFVLGILGGPGAGKTTLAQSLKFMVHKLAGLKTLVVSLEDFYFSPDMRASRGIAWRAMPGSHDLDSLAQFLRSVRSWDKEILVPRYDMSGDRPSQPEKISGRIDVVIFEGWLLNYRDAGYDIIADALDHLVYLDCSLADLRRWRLDREKRIRSSAKGRGYAAGQMTKFWEKVLAPGVVSWVLPGKKASDIIVRLTRRRQVMAIRTKAHPRQKLNVSH